MKTWFVQFEESNFNATAAAIAALSFASTKTGPFFTMLLVWLTFVLFYRYFFNKTLLLC
jgi:hypothetical protein